MNQQQAASHARRILALLLCVACCKAAATQTQSKDANATNGSKDTILFTNGEQLIGKLVNVVAGSVTFHSDTLGNITVPLARVKTLHAAQFALIEKNQRFTRKTADASVWVGAISLENDTVLITPDASSHASLAHPESTPAKNLDYLVDAASFHRELQGESSLRYGWTGSVTLGATLVKATNSAQTYTGSLTAVRAIPRAGWMSPSNKTVFNLSGTYGLARDPEIDAGSTVIQAASITKTDILHGDGEYDKYVSRRTFVLANASADHNYGNGLELQQAYGGGVGWSLYHQPKNSLDLKLDLQYLQQDFYNPINNPLGTPDANLVGLSLNETWSHTFARNIKLNEYLTLTPTFNVVQDFSAVVNANLVFPVYKNLSFTLASTDNYLGDPPEGYLRNTFQFTAGMTYVLK